MQNLPDHFPIEKRTELEGVVSLIRQRCADVEMVILFGSYARGEWREAWDLSPQGKSGHVSDYDILVVTESKASSMDLALWDDVSVACDEMQLSAPLRLIYHDIQAINIKLAEGHYFFSDIKDEGCLLFDSGRYTLADERELLPEERRRIAQDHFDHWFGSAKEFFIQYENAMAHKIYKNAAFQLHQMTESLYKTSLTGFHQLQSQRTLSGPARQDGCG